jgi:hypothetical protein
LAHPTRAHHKRQILTSDHPLALSELQNADNLNPSGEIKIFKGEYQPSENAG